MTAMLFDSGLSYTDFLGLEALLHINSVTSLVSLKFLLNKAEDLTLLNERLLEINRYLGIGEHEMKRISKSVIRLAIFLFFIG